MNIRLHALPVVDAKHGNLVGIVTAKDVMRDVIRMASKALPAEEKVSQKTMGDASDLAA
jgi:CBS domain-containing protein